MFEYVTVHLILCRLQFWSAIGLPLSALVSVVTFVGATDRTPDPWRRVKSRVVPWTLFVVHAVLFLVFLFYLIFVAPGDCGSCLGF